MSGKRARIKSGLAIISFILLLFAFRIEAFAPAQENQEEFFQKYFLSVQGCFELENVNGLVRVTTWPQPEVEIKAIKRTKRDPENLRLVRIEVKSLDNRVVVKTIYPRLRNTGVIVDYDIRLPEKLAETSLEVINGRIEISGNLGRIKASTVNGSIKAEGMEGSANFEAVNGEIEAVITSGPVKIETVNGPISCYLRNLKDNLSLETVNGSIRIKIASETNLNGYLEARSTNGAINIDVPLIFKSLTQSRGRFEGQIGIGGPLIRLRTVNGSISLSY